MRVTNYRDKLDENSSGYGWAMKLKESTLEKLYVLIGRLLLRFKPELSGFSGVGDEIQVPFSIHDYRDFWPHFPLLPKKAKPYNGAKTKFPFQKGSFRTKKWVIKSKETMMNFLGIFKTLKVTPTLNYAYDRKIKSIMTKVDEEEYDEIYRNKQKMAEFEKNFENGFVFTRCKIVVGKQKPGCKNKSYFTIKWINLGNLVIDSGILFLKFCYIRRENSINIDLVLKAPKKKRQLELIDEHSYIEEISSEETKKRQREDDERIINCLEAFIKKNN